MEKARGSAEVQEFTRLRAIALLNKGWKKSDIAEALGVSVRAIEKWAKKADE
jgi:transposase